MADKMNVKSEASSSSSSSTIDNGKDRSVIDDYGRLKSSCGYCKSRSNTSIAHGLWARSLTVHDYQALLDRGWRRSGCILYKPEMEKTCCPSYTIRLKASDFVPSKEQARVAKRMQR
ncbi:putative arginyltransferase [Helianthus anomalus]